MAPTTTSRWHISPRFPRLGLRVCVIVVNMAVSTGLKNFMKKFHTCTRNEDHGYGYIVTLISEGELWAFVRLFVIVYTLHSGVPGQKHTSNKFQPIMQLAADKISVGSGKKSESWTPMRRKW